MYGVAELDAYYRSSAGQKTARLLSQDILPLWPRRAEILELAVGFPFAFLPQRLMPPVLMPNRPGAAAWLGTSGILSAEIEPESWPIASDSLDRLFIAHALEFVPDPTAFLTEASRCLCGAGKLVMMVPHRGGLWVRSARTPFGHGIPFSRGQLHRLMLNCGLQPTMYHRSLVLPPAAASLPQSMQNSMERLGGRVARVFGGVLLVEATKMVYVKKSVQRPQGLRKLIQLQGETALQRTPSMTDETVL